MTEPFDAEAMEKALKGCLDKLPAQVRYRLENALLSLDRAEVLLELDREIASFRAITGEEEAASALLTALHLRNYPNSNMLKVRWHPHKAALSVIISAVASSIARGLKTLIVEVDLQKPRIDVMAKLTDLGVATPGREDLVIQLVEPLDVTAGLKGRTDGEERLNQFQSEMQGVATRAGYTSPHAMIRALANARNTLLYASDTGLPASRATLKDIRTRRGRAIGLGLLTIAILQTDKHQALVCQCIDALLAVLPRRASATPEPIC